MLYLPAALSFAWQPGVTLPPVTSTSPRRGAEAGIWDSDVGVLGFRRLQFQTLLGAGFGFWALSFELDMGLEAEGMFLNWSLEGFLALDSTSLRVQGPK